jgi:hypothetical protein
MVTRTWLRSLRLYCIKIGVLAVLLSGPVQAQTPAAQLAHDILTELNQLRHHPRRYSAQLTPWRAYYHRRRWQPPGQPAQRTREGVQGLLLAQTWLQQVQPLEVLRPHPVLNQVAATLLHQEITAARLAQQLNAQGRWEGQASFCRSRGLTNARAIVVSWLIDDGQPQRPNRTNLLNPLFRMAGVACDPHPRMNCVLILTGGYHARTAKPAAKPSLPSSLPPRSAAPRQEAYPNAAITPATSFPH